MAFGSISSNIGKVLSINSPANVFVFGDFTVHHKDWLTYSDGTYQSGKLCYNFFLSQTTLLRCLIFGSQTLWFSLSCFLDFFPLTVAFVLQWLSLHWHILIMLFSQFPLTFHHIHNRISCFIAWLMTICVLIETVFVIIWEMFHRTISLNSMLLLLLVNFASVFRLELMYISLIESIGSSLTYLHGFQQLLLLP